MDTPDPNKLIQLAANNLGEQYDFDAVVVIGTWRKDGQTYRGWDGVGNCHARDGVVAEYINFTRDRQRAVAIAEEMAAEEEED